MQIKLKLKENKCEASLILEVGKCEK